MPIHITEYVRERIRNHGDHTLRRFFDIFHHRMTAMFYRAWARVRPTVSFDQPSSDRFGDYVGSLAGLGMDSLENRDAFPDLPKRHFVGLMSNQTHHAEGLLAILSGYFRLPVQLEEFIGQWIELPTNCRCLMGQSSSGLGVNTTVGSHVWDCQQKFRVIFGPLAARGLLSHVARRDEQIIQRRDYSRDDRGRQRVRPFGAGSFGRDRSLVRRQLGPLDGRRPLVHGRRAAMGPPTDTEERRDAADRSRNRRPAWLVKLDASRSDAPRSRRSGARRDACARTMSRASSSPEFANWGSSEYWVKPATDSTLWLLSIRMVPGHRISMARFPP